jgi:hypothetical protein
LKNFFYWSLVELNEEVIFADVLLDLKKGFQRLVPVGGDLD